MDRRRKKSAARASFATYWAALENDKDFVGRAQVCVIDSQLDCVDGIKVLVSKTPTPAAEAETPTEAESEEE